MEKIRGYQLTARTPFSVWMDGVERQRNSTRQKSTAFVTMTSTVKRVFPARTLSPKHSSRLRDAISSSGIVILKCFITRVYYLEF